MEGSTWLALGAAALFFGGLALERALIWLRWAPYFTATFPLGEDLVPIPAPPEGKGHTRGVTWEVSEDSSHVRYWARGRGHAPMGLHGVVLLGALRRDVALEVRWAPPMSPLFACAWFVGLGLARGDGLFTVPIGVGLIVVILFAYRQAARRAAAELRWSFVSGDDA